MSEESDHDYSAPPTNNQGTEQEQQQDLQELESQSDDESELASDITINDPNLYDTDDDIHESDFDIITNEDSTDDSRDNTDNGANVLEVGSSNSLEVEHSNSFEIDNSNSLDAEGLRRNPHAEGAVDLAFIDTNPPEHDYAVPAQEANAENLSTPRSIKRKRESPNTTPKVEGQDLKEDPDDDGLTCLICCEYWEMNGPHRLISLKCGHLYGEKCIRRWLSDAQTSNKSCPQCKAKVNNNDFRPIYARRVRLVDRSEEYNLRDQLNRERAINHNLLTDVASWKMNCTLKEDKIKTLIEENYTLRSQLENLEVNASNLGLGLKNLNEKATSDPLKLYSYRINLERNFELIREPGCRVMIYSNKRSELIASQKSSQTLFPGFGVRLINAQTLRPGCFMHTSGKMVRDMTMTVDQEKIVVASQEPRIKMFDLRTKSTAVFFQPGDTQIWSCSMDVDERENFLYLGNQSGRTYVFDVRSPELAVRDMQVFGDTSPVINTAPVHVSRAFPSGGFLVCTLKSLVFYEYVATNITTTRLELVGPFISMNYDPKQETILISTRGTDQTPQARLIFGKLAKMDDIPYFKIQTTFMESRSMPRMTRCAQITVPSNTLVANYLQDSNQLAIYDVAQKIKIQTLPVMETVFDICPFTNNTTNIYMAGLTDTRCRIYKVNCNP